MTDKMLAKARKILDNYLETNQHRHTPERYAVLEAVFSMDGHFTLDELNGVLESRRFRVSKATLYNTMRIFIELRLVVRHGLADGTKYEACLDRENHVHQVCTVCGKVTEIHVPPVTDAIGSAVLPDFRQDAFALYIYGVCGKCQKMIAKAASADGCGAEQVKTVKTKKKIK